MMIVTPHIIRSREITSEDLKPFYIGTGQNFGAGSAPTLISPDAPPAPATAGPGQAGQAAPPPGAAPATPTTAPPPTGPPPAGQTPPPGTPPRVPGVVPIQPVETTTAPAAPPATPAQVELTTPGTEFQIGGGPYSVPIRVASVVSQVGAITLSITYDPKVLRATTINQGSFMQGGGITPAFAPKIDQSAGRVDIAISRGADTSGVSGTGLLAAVVFEAIAPGSSRIGLTAVMTSAAGKPIPVQTTGGTVTVK